jgi:hypothetical protein
MMGTFSDGSKDTFLYFQPEFETVEKCQQYVMTYAGQIKNQMFLEFAGKPIEQVFCIRQDRIPDVIQIEPGNKI